MPAATLHSSALLAAALLAAALLAAHLSAAVPRGTGRADGDGCLACRVVPALLPAAAALLAAPLLATHLLAAALLSAPPLHHVMRVALRPARRRVPGRSQS